MDSARHYVCWNTGACNQKGLVNLLLRWWYVEHYELEISSYGTSFCAWGGGCTLVQNGTKYLLLNMQCWLQSAMYSCCLQCSEHRKALVWLNPNIGCMDRKCKAQMSPPTPRSYVNVFLEGKRERKIMIHFVTKEECTGVKHFSVVMT
jgi:hypothetical protein